MFIFKKSSFLLVILMVFAIVFYLTGNRGGDVSNTSSESPLVFISPSASPLISPKPAPSTSSGPAATPLPTRELSEQAKLWLELGNSPAYCELKGEIKYVLVDDGPNHNNVYDNQDALFIYKGVDHPGRGIFWKVTPDDGLSVGPNLFAQLPLPDGENLIGVSLPDNPHYKTYELTASINYGRLVDGNIKMFTQECAGKTTVVLP